MEGQLVFVWRQPPVGGGRWIGPGIVIQQTTGGAWVNMRGALWRVSQEQMRSATSEENLGAELVNRYLHDLKWDIQRNTGPKKYVDVTKEGPRRDPGEDPSGEESPNEAGSDMDEDAEPEPADVPTSSNGHVFRITWRRRYSRRSRRKLTACTPRFVVVHGSASGQKGLGANLITMRPCA